jgi:hypothetical protein
MEKLKIKISLFGAAICLISALASQNAWAQDNEESAIMSLTEFTIKPGHNTQFREGVKAWKECYLEHEGDGRWYMSSRIQGTGSVYSLRSYTENWAEWDDPADEAGQACQNLALNLINPNVESATTHLSRFIPSISKTSGGGGGVVKVMYVRVKNGTLWGETVREVTSALRDAEGDAREYWYSSIGGGPDAPHYSAVTTYENFAAMDEDRDGIWTVVENQLGEEKRAELQGNFRESVDQLWSYLWRELPDLSHSGSE